MQIPDNKIIVNKEFDSVFQILDENDFSIIHNQAHELGTLFSGIIKSETIIYLGFGTK